MTSEVLHLLLGAGLAASLILVGQQSADFALRRAARARRLDMAARFTQEAENGQVMPVEAASFFTDSPP